METENNPTSARRPAWWEVRFPGLFYAIGVLFIIGAVLRISDWEGPADTLVIVLGLLVAALNVVAATATLVRRRRSGLTAAEQAPLAQESDPTRR